MYQLDWVTRCPDILSNFILSVSKEVFGDERGRHKHKCQNWIVAQTVKADKATHMTRAIMVCLLIVSLIKITFAQSHKVREV